MRETARRGVRGLFCRELSSPSCSGSAAAASAQQPFSPFVQVAQHQRGRFAEKLELAFRNAARQHPVGFPQAVAHLRVQLGGALRGHQALQPGVRRHALPADHTVFLEHLQDARGRRPAQRKHVLNVALEHGAFPAVRQNVKDHPALHPGDTQVLKGGVKPRFEPVRKQVDPGAAVLIHLAPPFLSEKQIVRTRTNFTRILPLVKGGDLPFPGNFSCVSLAGARPPSRLCGALPPHAFSRARTPLFPGPAAAKHGKTAPSFLLFLLIDRTFLLSFVQKIERKFKIPIFKRPCFHYIIERQVCGAAGKAGHVRVSRRTVRRGGGEQRSERMETGSRQSVFEMPCRRPVTTAGRTCGAA